MNTRGLIFVAALICLGGCAKSSNKPPCPPQSDCVVHDVGSEALVQKAMSRIEGKEIDKGDLCVERFEEFPNLVRVGYFANDAGCKYTGSFYRGVFWNEQAGLSSVVLVDLGWADQPSTRRQLAMSWSFKIELGQEQVLRDKTPPKGLIDSGYHPPRIEAGTNDAISVRAWVKLESGMSRDDYYAQMECVFSSSGAAKTKVLKRVIVPSSPRKTPLPDPKK